MRRLLLPIGVLALTGALVIGLAQTGGSEESEPFGQADLTAALESLRGAPAPLAALHAQAAELLPSGFEQRLRGLRGHPVVINKWGSWCNPCRAEFPILARQATEHGKEVAFLGLDAKDAPGPARGLLARSPVPYPSYEDPDEKLARMLDAAKYTPVTIFLDREGKVVDRHFGEYASEDDLRADIERLKR